MVAAWASDIITDGIRNVSSSRLFIEALSSAMPSITDTDTGTSCKLSSRLVAVTMISSSTAAEEILELKNNNSNVQ